MTNYNHHLFFMLSIVLFFGFLSSSQVYAISINVAGTADIWLAGMPDGSAASNGDVAPDQSPVFVPINIYGGEVITFEASGLVGNGPTCSQANPDGALWQGGFLSHSGGAQNGLSDINVTINSLIGVFLDDNQPDLTSAPSRLDFATIGLNFTELAPSLKQVFFIGDGITDNGDVQRFIAPDGATRLFLGTMDGSGWYNNTGSFDVNVNVNPVPEPGTIMLFGIGLLGLAGMQLHKRRSIK